MAAYRNKHALSSVDLLPDSADGLIAWAIAELSEGRRTDTDILFEFNDQLAAIGLGPISSSAFGRYAFKRREMLQMQAESLKLVSAFAERMDAKKADEFTITIIQMLKAQIINIAGRKNVSPKEINDMSRAVASLVNAQRASAVERQKFDAQTAKVVDEAFDAAEEEMEKSGRPDGKAILALIREQYGRSPGKADAPDG